MITFRALGKLGRFGNQLFQYTGTRLYAEQHGFAWAFPKWLGDPLFRLSHKPLGIQGRFLPTIQLADMASTSWSERFLTPIGLWKRCAIEGLYNHPQDNISLYGYLQDPYSLRLLATHKTRILEWFRFKNEIEQKLQSATQHLGPWIGVHIRQGDLLKRSKTVSLADYRAMLKKISDGRAIIIASDNPQIAKEFSEFNTVRVSNPISSLRMDDFDFWLLAHANTIIGGGSTFSWWAAYLGNKNDYWSPRLTHQWTPNYIPTFEKISL